MNRLVLLLTTVFRLWTLTLVNVNAADVNVTAVNGARSVAYDFSYHRHATDWLSAYGACANNSHQLLTSDGPEDIFNAFLIAFRDSNALTSYIYDITIWSGFYRTTGNESTYSSTSCDVVSSPPQNIIGNASKSAPVVCVTARYKSNSPEPEFGEASCDDQYQFVCVFVQDSFMIYTNVSAQYPADVNVTKVKSTNDSCRDSCLSDIYCVAATIHPPASTCLLAVNTLSAVTEYTLTSIPQDSVHISKQKDRLQVTDDPVTTAVASHTFQCLPPTVFETTSASSAVTTTVTTSTVSSSNVDTDQCLCLCAIYSLLNPQPNPTTSSAEQDAEFAQMLEDMTWKSKFTSKYNRKLGSASDGRTSATAIGWGGIVVLISFFIGIIFLDANRLYKGGVAVVTGVHGYGRK